jgi:hypothetical protein
MVLIDPTTSLKAKQNKTFRGRTLTLPQRRQLFHRWTSAEPEIHPHEALVGMLALLHAASSQEARLLRVDNIDQARCSVRLGERPHPVPLDPATWATLLRRLDHRAAQYTANPHVILEGCVRGQEVTRRVGRRAAEFLRDRTLRSRGLPAYQADPDAGRCVERYDACEPGPLSQFETEFERCADWRFHHWPLFVLTCDCQSTGIGLHLVRWGTALAWCPTDRLVVLLGMALGREWPAIAECLV